MSCREGDLRCILGTLHSCKRVSTADRKGSITKWVTTGKPCRKKKWQQSKGK